MPIRIESTSSKRFLMSCSHYSTLLTARSRFKLEHTIMLILLVLNRRIEIIAIKTMLRGLCYKLKSSDPLPMNPEYVIFQISSMTQGIDKLEKINLMIASNDTWQGIVRSSWPYSKGLKISNWFLMTSQHPKIQNCTKNWQ